MARKVQMGHTVGSLVTLLAITCVATGKEKEVSWHPSQDPAWELTFGDDFENSELDESNWFPGYRLGRVEYYKRIGYPNAHTRGWQPNPPLAHYVIDDGVLSLRVDKDLPKRDKPTTMTVSALTSAIYRYDEKSGDFRDDVKFSQKYGWWEMRCRMPVCGSGAYTAFWLHSVGARNQEYSPEGVRHGNPEGKSPAVEIDIFEWLGRTPGKNLFNVHFTKNGVYNFDCPCDLTRDFHVWAINWEEGKITWYLDGSPIHVYEGATPVGEMYLLMAMFQIGGWVGDIDEDLPYPMDFEVDYVRVWRKK
jgi:beta-glucanase (GH16 family)